MEGMFYDVLDPTPSQHAEPETSAYESLKFSLDLNLHEPKPQTRGTLTSPDLHLLKLSSPELEHLILQSCSGLSSSTPISTSARFLASKHITDEQQGFADGFVRALEDLHRQQHTPGMPGADAPPAGTGAPHTCPAFEPPHAHDEHQVWDGYPDAPVCTPVQNPGAGEFHCGPGLKDEPHRVPDTPPLSPIDMEDQERIKAERKRLRNRVAASKCRKRKLERLARLEQRVNRLSGENGELRTAAQALRDQVLQLRHQLLDHIKSGCKQLSQQFQTITDC
ncbi:transcription factor Jun-like [Trichomycterus rosablanca]|uniref:transcription factor Jun-like n=1 Tax=Trichomycterus rosablanca TaxID=2290929 RepID=UPI002F352599